MRNGFAGVPYGSAFLDNPTTVVCSSGASLSQFDGVHPNSVGAATFGRLLYNQLLQFRSKTPLASKPRNHRTTDLPDSDHIKACYLNASSIGNKFPDLEELVATEKFETIAITESWLNTKNRDFLAEYNLPRYSIFSCDRENRSEGGVILYIKNNPYPCAIQTEKINNVDLNSVELRSHNNKVIVYLIYRPPGQSFETDNKLFDVVIETCGHFETIVMENFNLALQGGVTHFGHTPVTNFIIIY